MKTNAITLLCAATIGLATATPALAGCDPDPGVATMDALFMRPALFATTVAGTAVFVVTLPFSALARSIKPAARALVVAPAKATFTRALGDFDYGKTPAESDLASAYLPY
jgi:hypothetical protein